MINNKAFDFIREARDNAKKNSVNACFSLHIEKSNLMRIGNSSVSLNTSENLVRLDIEVIEGKKTGYHTQMGTIDSVEYVEKALNIAIDKAKNAFELNYTPYLSGPVENSEKSDQYDKKLENLDTEYKVQFFKRIIQETGDQYNYSGSWSGGSVERFIISTKNNCEAWQIGTDQQFIMVLKHPDKKWELKSALSGWNLSDCKIEDAVNYFKSLLPVYENNEGYKVEPGSYTVALGPGAIAELLFASTEIAFNGQSYEDKQSWLCNNSIGDKIAPDFITFLDDPNSKFVFGMEFDDAGTKRKCFPFISEGKFAGITYDLNTAAKYKKELTGHSLQYVNNSVLLPGKDNPDILEAVKDLDKVIFIPDLHYVGIVSPTKGILTGSSRYNAVLIEKGKIVAPLFSCRLTERIGKIFNNIIRMSKESVSFNLSTTYERRCPFALGMPSYIVSENISLTDSSDSF